METKYTLGKWETATWKYEPNKTRIFGPLNDDNTRQWIGDIIGEETHEVNAKRIVECVNACAGQTIEDVKLATSHKNDCIAWEQLMMELVGEDGTGSVRHVIEKIKAERDEFLDIIIYVKKQIDNKGITFNNSDMYNQINSTLSKYK